MNRPEIIAAFGGAAAWPIAARAQQGDRIRRIGVLIQFPENDPQGQARVAAFREQLRKLGWSIGGNLRSIIAGLLPTRSGPAPLLQNYWNAHQT